MCSSDLPSRVGHLKIVCLVTCLVIIPFSGCAVTPPSPEPATITFVYPRVDTDYYEELAREFNEAHPLITVELRHTSGSALDDFNAGAVDVLVVSPFALSELQERGDILNLDPFIEQDKAFSLSDFYPGTVELLTSEGRTWAVPTGVDILVMFYNRDLFDRYEVPYPEIGWTWDDFLNSAVAISNPDADIFGYSTTGPLNALTYFDAVLFVYLHGGRLFDDLQNPTRTTFDDPLTVEALEWYARLYHEFDVAPTPQKVRQAFGSNQYALYDGLRQGQVGMWIGGLSERGGLSWPVEWLMSWGMAPLPRSAQSITQADVQGYVIHSKTQHPDACWQWIAFLNQQMPYRLIPARRSIAESAAYQQLVGQEVATVARSSMEHAVLINPNVFARFEAAVNIFAKAVGDVINEDSTPQGAMDQAQQEAVLKIQP